MKFISYKPTGTYCFLEDEEKNISTGVSGQHPGLCGVPVPGRRIWHFDAQRRVPHRLGAADEHHHLRRRHAICRRRSAERRCVADYHGADDGDD